jgi:hypothetical protein
MVIQFSLQEATKRLPRTAQELRHAAPANAQLVADSPECAPAGGELQHTLLALW